MPKEIQQVWSRFDAFPMETISKAWFLKNQAPGKQRSVPEMIAHRERTGASGNCFDLALWLMSEFRKRKIPAYGIGHKLGTPKAHVAVIAESKSGERYLCDLGDLWIQPLPVDSLPMARALGYSTGAWITTQWSGQTLEILFDRPGGKQSRQLYDLRPVSDQDFLEYGELSQKSLSRPLVEMRLFTESETKHWEFDDGKSFVSSMAGLEHEPTMPSMADWSERIALRTGMRPAYVLECLLAIEDLRGQKA